MARRAPLLGAIADDMTGATDLCSTLVREGMRTVQTIGAARDLELPDVDAVVVGLKSRTAPVADAVRIRSRRSSGCASSARGSSSSSTARRSTRRREGNIGPVADALLDALGADFTVVCPAYPANGRTVYRGHLFVGDTLLSESSMAQHPLDADDGLRTSSASSAGRRRGGSASFPSRSCGAGRRPSRRRLADLRAAGVAYAVVDALDGSDLRTIGRACADLPLVTGGAGVALGLPRQLPSRGLLRPHAGAPEPPRIEGRSP